MQLGIDISTKLKALDRLGLKLDFTEIMEQASDKFIAGRIRQNIREGKDKFGGELLPLKEETENRKTQRNADKNKLDRGGKRYSMSDVKRAVKKAHQPLIDTGELLNSSIWANVIGTNTVKTSVWNNRRRQIAMYHQKGARSRNLPARPFFGIPPLEMGKIIRQIKYVLMKAINWEIKHA